MKTPRWVTPLGCFILFGSAIFHTTGYFPLLRTIAAGGIQFPMEGLLKAFWLVFSIQLAALAVIAFLAHSMERGGRIVLWCAAATGVTSLLFLRFVGALPGVYLLSIVTVLFLIGGWQQVKQRPAA